MKEKNSVEHFAAFTLGCSECYCLCKNNNKLWKTFLQEFVAFFFLQVIVTCKLYKFCLQAAIVVTIAREPCEKYVPAYVVE